MAGYKPARLGNQLTLFPLSLEECVTRTAVSEDDIRQWHNGGLLSFGPCQREYQDFELAELQFVSALMRSGLSRSMIDRLLDGLPKPYRYDPHRVCYNFFLRAWRELPSESEDDLRERHFQEFRQNFLEYLEEYLDELVEAGEDMSVEDVYDRVRYAMRKVVTPGTETRGG